MEIPSEIYDQITLYVEDPQFEDGRFYAIPTQNNDKEGKQRLSTLRLVNKRFCQSASIRLFRSVRTVFSTTALRNQPIHWAPKNLFELSRSQYCSFVRQVAIDFGDTRQSSIADLRLFVQDLAALLPACLSNFHSLSSLSISGPAYSYFDKGSSSFLEDIRVILTNLVANLFRYIPLAMLKELKLALPVTHDFATLLANETPSNTTPARLSIRSVLKSISCLVFAVCDNSGPGGQRYFTNPPSSIQAAFPNQDHADKFFELVQLADRLEAISITSTHVLDMDLLNIKHLNKLHTIMFTGMRVSCSWLLSIAEQNNDSLKTVFLDTVELRSGTWEEFLHRLCGLPHLEIFHIDSCGYARDGTSSRFARGLPGIDDPQHIETYRYLDYNALGELQRHVNFNRRTALLPEMDQYQYRYAYRKPIEIPTI